MRNQISTMLTVSGLALAVFSSTTLAQVAPPPAKPPKQPAEAAPAAQPEDTKPKTRIVEEPPPGTASGARMGKLPTNIRYPPLAQKGEDGRVIRLKELPDILALRSNPTVGPKSVERIMPILYGRRARFEMLTIDNLDLYWHLTGGAIDNMSMGDLKGMTQIAEMIKPLVGKTTLSQELTNRGILSRVQGGMNSHIVQEYKKAIGDEIQVLEGDNSLDSFMRFVLNDSIHETKLAYQALLAELIPQVDEVVAKAGVGSSAVNGILAAKAPITGEPAQIEAQINAFDQRFRQLTLNEGIAVLSAMRQMRENPNVSPFIKAPNVMHSRKSIMDNNKMGVIVETGDEIDARDAKKREQQKAIRAERERAAEEARKALEADDTTTQNETPEEPAEDPTDG